MILHCRFNNGDLLAPSFSIYFGSLGLELSKLDARAVGEGECIVIEERITPF